MMEEGSERSNINIVGEHVEDIKERRNSSILIRTSGVATGVGQVNSL